MKEISGGTVTLCVDRIAIGAKRILVVAKEGNYEIKTLYKYYIDWAKGITKLDGFFPARIEFGTNNGKPYAQLLHGIGEFDSIDKEMRKAHELYRLVFKETVREGYRIPSPEEVLTDENILRDYIKYIHNTNNSPFKDILLSSPFGMYVQHMVRLSKLVLDS